MSELPRTTQSKRIGRSGESYVKHIVEEQLGSMFQEIAQQNQYGYDALVQLFNDRSASGILVPVQIKTGRSRILWKDSNDKRLNLKVAKKHVNLWRDSNLPVLLVWVDPSEDPPVAIWSVFDSSPFGA